MTPLTDEEMNYTAEQWAEAFAEDPSCIRTYILAAYARGLEDAAAEYEQTPTAKSSHIAVAEYLRRKARAAGATP